MQAEAGDVQLAQLGGGIQCVQAADAAPPEVRAQAGAAAGEEQIPQALVAEAPNHWPECKVTRYRLSNELSGGEPAPDGQPPCTDF